jgi:hypothetical protein
MNKNKNRPTLSMNEIINLLQSNTSDLSQIEEVKKSAEK